MHCPACTLHHASLDVAPEYKAPSHTWSGMKEVEELPSSLIFVNSTQIRSLQPYLRAETFTQSGETIVIVRGLHMHQPGQSPGAQRAGPADEYQQAWRITCCIGEADSSSAEGLHLLSDIASEDKDLNEYFLGRNDETVSRRATALSAVLMRSWFYRTCTASLASSTSTAAWMARPWPARRSAAGAAA